MRSSRPATPAPGWPPRCSESGACPASTGPRSRSRWSARAGRSCSSTSARTPIRPPRTSPSTAGWGDLRRARPRRRDPRVALLSIGEEKGKGDLRIQRATELLDASGLNFVGNVEGKDLTSDNADVVVTDAVAGNVVIKFFEGLSTFIFDLFRAEFRRSLRGRLAYLLFRPGIGRIRQVFDYETRRWLAAPGYPRER